jgi:hypothetical protein
MYLEEVRKSDSCDASVSEASIAGEFIVHSIANHYNVYMRYK